MAISTYKAYLMKGTPGTGSTITYTKLVDIKDFPDLGGAPELLETTTTSDSMTTFILGIQSLDALEFTANYDKDDYEDLLELHGTQTDYAVYFGDAGENGIFKWKGDLSVFVNGGGVNEVVDMTITIAPSTVIEYDPGT